MTTSPELLENFVTDTWVKATWEKFMALAYDPAYKTGKAYYNRGKARIEMTPLGWNHAEDNSIISTLVVLFCALKRIPVRELTNCSLRKTEIGEAQPDISLNIKRLKPIFLLPSALCLVPRTNINADLLAIKTDLNQNPPQAFLF
jgi:Uma2 family endonuclease